MHRLVAGLPYDDVLDPYVGVDRRGDGDRPWVMANMVGGLDGSAAFGGRVGPLSAGADAVLFRRMRALADVVLVGAETVRLEHYGPVRLTDDLRAARTARGLAAVPPLAVVTRSLRLDWSSSAFAEADPSARPIVMTTADADAERCAEAGRHADVVVAGEGRVDLAAALDALGGRGHRVVLCEGGPTLLGELVDARLLDELCLTVAPLLGGDELPIAVTSPRADVTAMRLAGVAAEDDTLFLRYRRSDERSDDAR